MSLHTVCHTVEFDEEMWDMCVVFEVMSYSPGYAGDFYEPPHGSEYEFKIVHIEHDLPTGSAPEYVSVGLSNAVKAWFNSEDGYAAASEKADEDRSYRDGEN